MAGARGERAQLLPCRAHTLFHASFLCQKQNSPARGIWEMPKGREGDKGLWHPSNPQQVPVTRASWKRAEAKSLCRALEGRGDQYQERKRKLVATAVVFTTSGMTFVSLQDLSLSRDQTEKGSVRLCQKRREEEEEGERRQDIHSRGAGREQVMPWTDQSVNPAVKTDPGAGHLWTVFFLKFAKH